MSRDLSTRLKDAAGPDRDGPDIDAAMRRGDQLRRRRRVLQGLGPACVALVAIGVAMVVLPPDNELAPIGEGDDAAAVLEAHAAEDPDLWPIRMVYEQQYPPGYANDDDPGGVAAYEFVGTSWNDWQLTQVQGSRENEVIQRHRPEFGNVAPAHHLRPNWHEPGWSLRQVDLDAVPDSDQVIDQLGLAPSDVRAFASPTVADCTHDAIEDCPTAGRDRVRALMHYESGLPLYRQMAFNDEPMATFVVTELSLADPTALPEP